MTMLVYFFFQDEEPSERFARFVTAPDVSESEWLDFKVHASFSYYSKVDVEKYSTLVDSVAVSSNYIVDMKKSCFYDFDYSFEEAYASYISKSQAVVETIDRCEQELKNYLKIKLTNPSPKISPSIYIEEGGDVFIPRGFELVRYNEFSIGYAMWSVHQLQTGEISDSEYIDRIRLGMSLASKTNSLRLSVQNLVEVRYLLKGLESNLNIFRSESVSKLTNSLLITFTPDTAFDFHRWAQLYTLEQSLTEALNTRIKSSESKMPFRLQKTLNQAAEQWPENLGDSVNDEVSLLRNWNNWAGYVLLKVASPKFIALEVDFLETATRTFLIKAKLNFNNCSNKVDTCLSKITAMKSPLSNDYIYYKNGKISLSNPHSRELITVDLVEESN
ncbi:hypothetical protein [Pleionea mediterranea]|nr:hypothetical protein [Pleionea mediterranea]